MRPNHAFYQLNYIRIFNFCHYTTAEGKIKDFSVCGHSCGQSHFYAAFGNRRKSCKRRCCKALRRFASPYPGYRHGTPKAGALPTALHPVISFFIRLVVFHQSSCAAPGGGFPQSSCAAPGQVPLYYTITREKCKWEWRGKCGRLGTSELIGSGAQRVFCPSLSV